MTLNKFNLGGNGEGSVKNTSANKNHQFFTNNTVLYFIEAAST